MLSSLRFIFHESWDIYQTYANYTHTLYNDEVMSLITSSDLDDCLPSTKMTTHFKVNNLSINWYKSASFCMNIYVHEWMQKEWKCIYTWQFGAKV